MPAYNGVKFHFPLDLTTFNPAQAYTVLAMMMLVRSQRTALRVLPRRTFMSKIFGSPSKKVAEIVEKQDEYKEDQQAPITFLNKENSPNYKPFSIEEDMPDFKINQWKSTFVRARDLETTFTNESISNAINETYTEVFGKNLTPNEYLSTNLSDLQLRFQFCKTLQQKLGFDISDYLITRSHNVDFLFGELKKQIAARWSSERNPNAIVLREEDFEQPNVYLNKELDEYKQKEYFEKLKEEAAAQLAAQ